MSTRSRANCAQRSRGRPPTTIVEARCEMAPEAVTSERVYAGLRRAVVGGRYPPGTTLNAQAIAEEFGTSIAPVRDAMHRLVGEGLIEAHHGGGFRFRPFPKTVSGIFMSGTARSCVSRSNIAQAPASASTCRPFWTHSTRQIQTRSPTRRPSSSSVSPRVPAMRSTP